MRGRTAAHFSVCSVMSGLPLVWLCLACLPLQCAAAAEKDAEGRVTPKLPLYPHPERTVRELEQIIDSYYRTVQVDTIIEKTDAWVEAANAEMEKDSKALDARVARLEAMDKELAASKQALKKLETEVDKKTKKAKEKALKLYNKKVDEHNALVDKRDDAVRAYDKARKEFNRKNERFQREAKRKEAGVDRAIKAYNRFYDDGEDTAFATKLDHFHAHLTRAKGSKKMDPAVQAAYKKVVAFRKLLSDWTVQQAVANETGMLYVDATLCGKQPCNFLIDTGASSVTISFGMVLALGLEDKLGREITMTIAGGQKLKGRELVLPSMTVQGKTLKDVKAVALPESEVGSDGLLGHTFLDRFHYVIDSSKQPPLSLRPKKVKAASKP